MFPPPNQALCDKVPKYNILYGFFSKLSVTYRHSLS